MALFGFTRISLHLWLHFSI